MAHLAYVRLVRILFHEHVWKLCPGRATVVIARSASTQPLDVVSGPKPNATVSRALG